MPYVPTPKARFTSAQDRVRKAVNGHECGERFTYKEIGILADTHPSNASNILSAMLQNDELRKGRKGQYYRPSGPVATNEDPYRPIEPSVTASVEDQPLPEFPVMPPEPVEDGDSAPFEGEPEPDEPAEPLDVSLPVFKTLTKVATSTGEPAFIVVDQDGSLFAVRPLAI